VWLDDKDLKRYKQIDCYRHWRHTDARKIGKVKLEITIRLSHVHITDTASAEWDSEKNNGEEGKVVEFHQCWIEERFFTVNEWSST
jgi:hypothetical protein